MYSIEVEDRGCGSISFGETQPGDIGRLTQTINGTDGELVLRTYNTFVSLTRPDKTWTLNLGLDNKPKICWGRLILLPKGTRITITV